MNIDYLADSTKPKVCFFNSKITTFGLIPEVIFIDMGFIATKTITLFNWDNEKCCEVEMPPNLIGNVVENPIIVHQNKVEFYLTEVYLEHIL